MAGAETGKQNLAYRSPAFFRIAQLALSVVMVLGALGFMAEMLRDCWDPGELDYGEGVVMWQAKHITDPAMTYRNIGTPPFLVTHYPPVYHLATRAMETWTHNWVAAGRLVSTISGIATTLVIGALVLIALPRRVSRADRWVAALFGACSVFFHPFSPYWLRTARVDSLGMLLTVAALTLYIWRRERLGWQLVTMALFVLAGFTKQTLFIAPAVCLLLEAFLSWRRAMLLAAWGAVLAAVPLWLMQQRTGGGFLLNLVFYNVNPMHLKLLKPFLSTIFYSPWMLFALALPAIFLVVRRVWTRRGRGIAWWRVRCESSVLTRALLVLTAHFSISAALTLVAGAKQGTSTNYFLPILLTSSPLAGITIWRIFAGARNFRRCDAAVAGSLALLAVACQPMVNAIPRITTRAYNAIREAHPEERTELAEIVRTTPGPIYSENMVLLMQANRELIGEPAILTSLAATGRWDERPFLQMLERREISLILARGLDSLDGLFSSPAVRERILQNYEKTRQLDGIELYYPRHYPLRP